MLSKELIAESFSRSADRYDQAASVQQQAGKELLLTALATLPKGFSPQTLADIGCGTGFLVPELLDALKPEQYIGVDLAQGMLDLAAKRYEHLKQVHWHCGDAENLDLPESSIDVIYANFSLQWCEDLPALMRSFHRVLKPGGYCCFTSLGADSLNELRGAWACVDKLKHVNRFYDQSDWALAIEASDLNLIHSYQNTTTAYFDTVKDALRSFKDIGANVVDGKRHQGLTGKGHFARFIDAYEAQRQTEGIPVSYVIDGWVLSKPLLSV